MDGRRARIVLGVDTDAAPDDIRRAFRTRALVTHPDRGGDRVTFELVVLAFETLQHVDISHRLPERPMLTVRPTLTARPMLAGARPRVDVYDSPPRRRPRRRFDDVLHAAIAHQTA